jgi:hypothetical protein
MKGDQAPLTITHEGESRKTFIANRGRAGPAVNLPHMVSPRWPYAPLPASHGVMNGFADGSRASSISRDSWSYARR